MWWFPSKNIELLENVAQSIADITQALTMVFATVTMVRTCFGGYKKMPHFTNTAAMYKVQSKCNRKTRKMDTRITVEISCTKQSSGPSHSFSYARVTMMLMSQIWKRLYRFFQLPTSAQCKQNENPFRKVASIVCCIKYDWLHDGRHG